MLLEFVKMKHPIKYTVQQQKRWRYEMSSELEKLRLAIDPNASAKDRIFDMENALRSVTETLVDYEYEAKKTDGWSHADYEGRNGAINDFLIKEELHGSYGSYGIERDMRVYDKDAYL